MSVRVVSREGVRSLRRVPRDRPDARSPVVHGPGRASWPGAARAWTMQGAWEERVSPLPFALDVVPVRPTASPPRCAQRTPP